MKNVLLYLIIFESLYIFFLLCYKLFEKVGTTYTLFFLISGLELSIYTPSGQRGDRIIVTSNTNRNKEYWGSFSFFFF